MKGLGSKWVSGALVTVALLVVVYQFINTGRGHKFSPQAQPASAPPAASASSPQHTSPRNVPSKDKGTAALTGVDREYIALHFAAWTDTARRDPFLLHPPPNQKGTNPPSLVSQWKLRAIWRQTGSRVAAINNGIYKEGDDIQGYKVLRIEDNVVWFQNPDSLDHLELQRPAASSPAPDKAPANK